jgi:3-hydroxybutyryl-CoA dehydratase
MAQLQSYTFDELPIGKKATYTRTVTEQDIALFAVVSGDVNPLHLDAEFAKGTMFGERIAHGMMTGAIVSAALVMALTGPGAIYRSQSLRFRRPVKIGDVITVHLEITERNEDKKVLTIDCNCINQNGESVALGVAEIVAPSEKVSVELPPVPKVTIQS